jgi:hypothetical protein
VEVYDCVFLVEHVLIFLLPSSHPGGQFRNLRKKLGGEGLPVNRIKTSERNCL